jgi:2-dehydro-3-deoxygluconokinase
MQNSSILFIGEAMLELVNIDKKTLAKSFAGDVYNTSVYLKRAYSDVSASLVSAIGTDALSEEFKQVVLSENIEIKMLAQSPDSHMGTYMVVTDEHGERSFIYWRSQSAARQMMSNLSESQKQSAFLTPTGTTKTVFFSGITLAILLPDEREKFWEFITSLKATGAQIIFDPNYRERLWESKECAKQQMEIAFQLSDWLMPGLEDFTGLYGLTSIDQCIDFCAQYGFEELVLKQGAESVHVINTHGHEEIAITPSENVVDTTSAGDAFNGIYIGARLAGDSVAESVRVANYAACQVIATPGAIMPKEVFEKSWLNR